MIDAADKMQVYAFPDGTAVTYTKKWKEVSVELSHLIIATLGPEERPIL